MSGSKCQQYTFTKPREERNSLEIATYRWQTRPPSRIVLYAGCCRANTPKRVCTAEAIWIPRLRTRDIIPIRVARDRWVEPVQPARVVTSHGIVVEVGRHRTVRVKLTRRLTVQRLLVTLGARRACRRIVVIHVLGRRCVVHNRRVSSTLARVARNVIGGLRFKGKVTIDGVNHNSRSLVMHTSDSIGSQRGETEIEAEWS